MDVATAVAKFGEWCQANRASNTYLLYRSRLRSLPLFVPPATDERPNPGPLGPIELDALLRSDVEAWLAESNRKADGQLKAPDTIRATAIAYTQFQKWALDYGYLRTAVVPAIKKPMGRQRERIPEDDETAKLLEHAPPAFALVYKALRQCGARPNELCRATIADYGANESVIVLAEHKTALKTGKPRRIAVGRRMAELLEEAIGGRQSGPIFLTQKGVAWTPQNLSTVYRRLRNRAGLKKDLVLYLTRHEHGSKICKALGIKAAAEALGHATITTTQRYVHTTDRERAANQDVFV